MYEIEPNYFLTKEYSNLYIVPMICNVDIHKTENVPLVIINFLTDSVYLSKGEVMGFMHDQSLNISEIVTETSTEPSPILLEDDDIEGLPEQKRKVTSENREKKFIKSPADIEVHQKVELQDADITEAQQNVSKNYVMNLKISFL